MTTYRPVMGYPWLQAISISPGGIPKLPVAESWVSHEGLNGDGRHHAKHLRPERAVSIWDREILDQLVAEGFPLVPGAAGENLTVARLHVQCLPPGTLLQIGALQLRLEEPRKPCYVLDAIDPRLKEAMVGRCGYLASVIVPGRVSIGMAVRVLTNEEDRDSVGLCSDSTISLAPRS